MRYSLHKEKWKEVMKDIHMCDYIVETEENKEHMLQGQENSDNFLVDVNDFSFGQGDGFKIWHLHM